MDEIFILGHRNLGHEVTRSKCQNGKKIRNSQIIPRIIVSSTIYNILTFRLLVWKIQPIQVIPTEWPPKSARGYNSVTVSPRGLRLSQRSLGPKVTPYTIFCWNRRGSGVRPQSFCGGMPQLTHLSSAFWLLHKWGHNAFFGEYGLNFMSSIQNNSTPRIFFRFLRTRMALFFEWTSI